MYDAIVIGARVRPQRCCLPAVGIKFCSLNEAISPAMFIKDISSTGTAPSGSPTGDFWRGSLVRTALQLLPISPISEISP